MTEEILWNRNLSCGHYRLTNFAFIARDFTSPVVGDNCYCRQCHEDVTIISVEKASEEQVDGIREVMKVPPFNQVRT